MRKMLFGTTGVFALALVAGTQMFVAPACKAQSEINPDHFDGTDAWAAAQTAHPAKPATSVAKATMRAQSENVLLVNIPFAFTAGRKTLPAGEYRIQKSPADSVKLLIRRTDQSAATFATSTPAVANEKQAQSKLVFHRYGDRYFLSRVWIAGDSGGRELARSAKGKEEALLARNETSGQVTIAARLLAPQP